MTEGDIQKSIFEYLVYRGHLVIRVNVETLEELGLLLKWLGAE